LGDLENEYMKLGFGKIVKSVSQSYFEIVVGTQAWLLYSFLSQIFLQSVVLQKEYMKQNVGMIVDKMFEN